MIYIYNICAYIFCRSLRVVKEAEEKSMTLPLHGVHASYHIHIYYTREELEPGTEIIPVVCRPRYSRYDRVAPTTGEDMMRSARNF